MNTAKVRALNDARRTTFTGGKLYMTAGVAALPLEIQAAALDAVRTHNVFDNNNDPYGEHDFGSFDLVDQKFFWKIDYYDEQEQMGSEDPADPEQTTQVLTVMLAEEY